MQVFINQDLNVRVLLGGFSSASNALFTNEVMGEGDFVTEGSSMGGDASIKDPTLSSWPFVIGISSGTLIISIIIGILLAKRKIKKGFELYED